MSFKGTIAYVGRSSIIAGTNHSVANQLTDVPPPENTQPLGVHGSQAPVLYWREWEEPQRYPRPVRPSSPTLLGTFGFHFMTSTCC